MAGLAIRSSTGDDRTLMRELLATTPRDAGLARLTGDALVPAGLALPGRRGRKNARLGGPTRTPTAARPRTPTRSTHLAKGSEWTYVRFR